MDVARPASLEIGIMGDVVVTARGARVTEFESTATLAMLCRLAVDVGRPIRRDDLAELLWPGRPAGRALGNLRHSLTVLRRVIDDDHRHPFIDAVGCALVLNADRVRVDLAEFRRLVVRRSSATTDDLRRAYALRRGPMLAGLDGTLNPDFDHWLTGQRVDMNAEFAALLDRLTAISARLEAPGDVIPLVREWIECDPWNERAHARLVRLLALEGHSVAAIEHARQFVDDLSEQFGLQPDADLRAAIDDVRWGRVVPPVDESTIPALW